MNKTENGNAKRIFPIRFHKLRVGSEYQIFAEPSRNIRKSNDTTVYVKEAESYSVAKNDKNKAIILMQEDLVIPLTRGNN
jgi:hypothetical protein